jgi:hypothetical protein
MRTALCGIRWLYKTEVVHTGFDFSLALRRPSALDSKSGDCMRKRIWRFFGDLLQVRDRKLAFRVDPFTA